MAPINVNEALEGDEIIDLHGAYRMAHECGFNRDLIVSTGRASDIAARLRGISGITSVLITDKLNVELGDYIRSTLIEAVGALARDCESDLEESRKWSEKMSQEAKTKEAQHA